MDDCDYIKANNYTTREMFRRNKNSRKCKYCSHSMQNCDKCNETCYVCIVCKKSQLTGNELEYYSYLCETHAKSYENGWTRDLNKVISDNKCTDCGMNEITYKDVRCCGQKYDFNFCINCCSEDKIMDGLYCYECY